MNTQQSKHALKSDRLRSLTHARASLAPVPMEDAVAEMLGVYPTPSEDVYLHISGSGVLDVVGGGVGSWLCGTKNS